MPLVSDDTHCGENMLYLRNITPKTAPLIPSKLQLVIITHFDVPLAFMHC